MEMVESWPNMSSCWMTTQPLWVSRGLRLSSHQDFFLLFLLLYFWPERQRKEWLGNSHLSPPLKLLISCYPCYIFGTCYRTLCVLFSKCLLHKMETTWGQGHCGRFLVILMLDITEPESSPPGLVFTYSEITLGDMVLLISFFDLHSIVWKKFLLCYLASGTLLTWFHILCVGGGVGERERHYQP